MIDKDNAVRAQSIVDECKNPYFWSGADIRLVDECLITADQLRELLDDIKRYKAALEFIASSSNCGTCDACLGSAKDALKP